MQSPKMPYIVRQPGEPDQEFPTSIAAVEHLVSHPGYAKLFCNDELIMTKGIPPHAAEHNVQVFRGIRRSSYPAEA